MPATDRCHEQVVRALQKDGWIVSPQPVSISTPINTLLADIEAEKPGQPQTIIIEVKCFPRRKPPMAELYVAIGQYLVYRGLLRKRNPDAALYLAIPARAYRTLFVPLAASAIEECRIRLLVVNLEQEEIVQWIT